MAGFRDLLSRPRWAFVVALTCVTIVGLIFMGLSPRDHGEMAFPLSGAATGFATSINVQEFVKPSGVKVIGLVFFGRRDRVEMLRCYLEVRVSALCLLMSKTNHDPAEPYRQRWMVR